VAALSCYKFLLTFPTVEEMDFAVANQDELQHWFLEVKKWGSEDDCDSRRVWLSIIGVPPHGWQRENFKQIAELWGDLICLSKPTTSTDSFEVMKVLVATKILRRIDEEVLLQLDYGGYRVIIREAETVSQALQRTQLIMNGETMEDEDKDSNFEVPGFEDLEVIKGMAEHKSNQSQKVEEGAGSQCMDANSNSNSNGIGDNNINDVSQHEELGSRTNTASFSQNGYSEEIFKISRHSRRGTNGMVRIQEDKEAQAPPGFEKVNANHAMDSIDSIAKSRDNEDCLPGEEKDQRSKSQETDTEPPGFEATPETRERQVQLGTKQKKSRKGKQLALNAHPSPSNTEETSESMLKLAEESLQVGELLGVRVIGNKKAAITRITDHLKKRKAQGRSSQNQHKH